VLRGDSRENSLLCCPRVEIVSVTLRMYERTYEQNDALGLNDMKVENYETPDTIPEEDDEKTDEDGDAVSDSQTRQLVQQVAIEHPKDSQPGVSPQQPTQTPAADTTLA